MSNKSISIIVPAHNEGEYIASCIKAIISNCEGYLGDTEIIIVDNNSKDNTYNIASSFNVKVIKTSATTPAAVRNAGAELASYDILAFIDGDCIVSEKWLKLLNIAYQNEKVGAYGGQHVAPVEGNWVVKSWNPTTLKESYNEHAKLPGGNFSIRKKLFKVIGGFNEGLTSAEDDFLSEEVMGHNYLCVSDSKNFVIHLGYPKSLIDVFTKQRWHGATQIKAHGFFGDKLVLVTYAWLVSLLLFIYGLYFDQTTMSIAFVSMNIFTAAVFLNRLKYHQQYKIKSLPCAFIISFFYISGRACGLLQELNSLIFRKKE